MSNKQKSTAIYKSPFSRAYWRDACAELKDTRMLVIAALFIALRVAMKGIFIPLAPNLNINTGFFVNALGAMIYGPVVAVIGAAISDTLGCIIFPQGVYFFPFIFIEIASSLFFSLFLYRTKVTATRVVLSRFCVNFFVNIVMNMPIMALYYKVVLDKSYTWLQLPAIAKNLCMFPVEALLLVLFMAVMVPVVYRLHLVYCNADNLKVSKKLTLGLVGLFVASVVVTGSYLVYNYNTANQASWLETEEKQELNTALNRSAQEQNLVEDSQILIISKINRKLGEDEIRVTFNVYDVAEGADTGKMMSYRSSDAKKDENLALVTSGTALTAEDRLGTVTELAVKEAE